MKKLLKMLAVSAATFLLLCSTLPAAFAAKDENVFNIGLDAQGGACSTVVVFTDSSGRLEAVPEQPAMDGYIFDGWYTEPVGGSKISTSTVFTADTTVYAHWIVKSDAGTTASQPSTLPATIPWKKLAAPVVVAGALLTTVLLASAM